MATLSTAKTMGAVGSILVLLTAIPTVGGILGIVGFILMLVAIKYISEIVGDNSIYRNMLIAVGLAIVSIIVGVFVVLGVVLQFVGLSGASFGPDFNPSAISPGDWAGLIGSALVGLAVIWLVLLGSAVFVRRTYSAMSSKLGVGMFGTAGLLYLIGAATTIILVGFLLLLVAQILLVVAFFSIEERPMPQAGQPVQPGSTST